MYKLIVVITVLIFIPTFATSQQITGKIYDNESSVKGAKILNTNNNIFTYSNEYGDFSINASIHDTLKFTSLFHEEKKVLLNEKSFENTIVVELSKIVNSLEEVLLMDKTQKTFKAENYTADIGLQIKNDIKNNPHLYSPPPSGNIDFVKIASLIGKLFKNNKNSKTTSVIPITYKELDSLFTKHKFLNEKLLKNDLKIPKEYIPLFFDYCENKNIDNKLLLEENHLLLLEKLITYSKEFLIILSEYKKGKD
ncbi:hypothetical protein CJ739_322 [Mariniflexile rhizosphaerae]|uniref:hypothetical protein n=1 Tax=unclassified Mariniflexile TaxID=2643887 RepID=UPI000CC69FAC|nr:hypothetical protein [Mariniflexile sp. TRM1-10]AXP79420.1 hypothetical protein CJ739_322 [Mariniflexile sp. TRM1-10]PLB19373.1 MAG: hypothetical protein TRG1_1671 [Flavobacteriaceae bacterium FS1-H7996/R]